MLFLRLAHIKQSGIVRSLIFHVLINSDDGLAHIGTGFDLGPLVDSVSLLETQVWFVTGVGVRIGHGSEVRIEVCLTGGLLLCVCACLSSWYCVLVCDDVEFNCCVAEGIRLLICVMVCI